MSQSQILAVVNTLQEDIIYEKYGYEREDIERKLAETPIDTSLRNKCKSILEAEVVSFNYLSLESEEEGITPRSFDTWVHVSPRSSL